MLEKSVCVWCLSAKFYGGSLNFSCGSNWSSNFNLNQICHFALISLHRQAIERFPEPLWLRGGRSSPVSVSLPAQVALLAPPRQQLMKTLASVVHIILNGFHVHLYSSPFRCTPWENYGPDGEDHGIRRWQEGYAHMVRPFQASKWTRTKGGSCPTQIISHCVKFFLGHTVQSSS